MFTSAPVSPTSPLPAVPPAGAAAPFVLTDEAVRQLQRARGWARFLAILGFVFCGLMSLGIIATMIGGTMGAPLGRTEVVAMLVFGGLVGGLFLWLSALTWGYGKGLGAFSQGSRAGLTSAFQSLRHLWILQVVLQVLSLLWNLGQLLQRF